MSGYSLDSIFSSASWAIWQHSTALSKLQEKASTGQDINRPSDDATDAGRILGLRTESRSMEVYMKALGDSVSTLDFSSSVVQQIDDEMISALSYITSISTGGAETEETRGILANQINSILEQVVSLANSQLSGHYLFSGASSDVQPYTVTRDSSGNIANVTYQGSSNERKVAVAPGVEISPVLVGDELFRTNNRQAPDFISADDNGVTTTGVVAGSGTSSVRGDTWLTVTDTGGGGYSISIDGGASTVTGNVVDANASNVPVVNSVTGEVLYVDVTGMTGSGTEPIRVQGTYDTFNILINARDLLNDEQGLHAGNRALWDSMMSSTIESMQSAQERLTHSFPKIGGRVGTLVTLQKSIEDMKFNADEEVSRLQDADITQVAVDLARHEVLYQMSLSVAAKMFSLSLMDFVR
ncbi:MAG: flagellar hook-associated protein FlgL [Planctomycetota bacterium]|jgi:flagellar hook-associated protein 3 FlgL